MNVSEIKPADWGNLFEQIYNRKYSLVVGDDLILVNGVNLNTYIASGLYEHSLELMQKQIEAVGLECNDIRKYAQKNYNICDGMPVNQFLSKKITELYKKDDNGSIELFIQELISNINKEDVDVSLFTQILEETEPRLIVSTCYSPLLIEKFISYCIDNSLNPYIADILGGDSTGGFTIYHQQTEKNKLIWKDGSHWEGRSNEVLFLSIGGNFVPKDCTINNLCLTEDDWVKMICKWIVSIIHTSGNTPLVRHLSEGYLLVLGTRLPSWAFRFLWYTLNNPELKMGFNMAASLSVRPEPHNENVKRFITSHNSLLISANETNQFVKEFITRWKEWPYYDRFKDCKVQRQPSDENIFISYLTEDRNVLEKFLIPILEKLQARHGYTFWYDKRSLRIGDDWNNCIKNAIEKANCFICFHTENTLAMSEDRAIRYLQFEWREALSKKKKFKKNKNVKPPRFIIPITYNGIENLSNQFSSSQNIEITEENAEQSIMTEIEKIINESKIYNQIVDIN